VGREATKEGNKTALFRQGEWVTVIFDIAVMTEIEKISAAGL